MSNMIEKKVILIDDISSISESYFSFKYKKKLLNVEPFILKVKVNPKQNSHYHFNAGDLEKMNELEPSIFPFHQQTQYTKNEYIGYMKKQFEIIIKENRILPLLEYVYGTQLENYEFRWFEKK